MLTDARVIFANRDETDADKVKLKDNGWVGVRGSDGWVYYPAHHIDCIICPDADIDPDQVEV